MPVRIVHSKAAKAAVAAPKATPVKGIKLGKSEVRPDFDFTEEQGKIKFLVHRKKPGIWYRVRAHDAQTGALKLSTINDKGVFPSSASRSMMENYVLVVEPDTEKAPSDKAIAHVQKK